MVWRNNISSYTVEFEPSSIAAETPRNEPCEFIGVGCTHPHLVATSPERQSNNMWFDRFELLNI